MLPVSKDATLFILSFWLLLAGSTRRANEEALQHQQPLKTIVETLVDPQFWIGPISAMLLREGLRLAPNWPAMPLRRML